MQRVHMHRRPCGHLQPRDALNVKKKRVPKRYLISASRSDMEQGNSSLRYKVLLVMCLLAELYARKAVPVPQDAIVHQGSPRCIPSHHGSCVWCSTAYFRDLSKSYRSLCSYRRSKMGRTSGGARMFHILQGGPRSQSQRKSKLRTPIVV